MRWIRLAPLAFVALLGACMVSVGPDAVRQPGAPPPAPAAEVDAFAELAAEARRDAGCSTPLAWHADVAAAAQGHSEDMRQRDYFDHVGPDGRTPMQRVQSAGVEVSAVAENIAHGQPTAVAVLESWLGSPGHRRNLLNCEYTHHGVGLSGTYWTHVLVRLR